MVNLTDRCTRGIGTQYDLRNTKCQEAFDVAKVISAAHVESRRGTRRLLRTQHRKLRKAQAEPCFEFSQFLSYSGPCRH
jgi:hypothetical protein